MIVREVVVPNRLGLHARAAAKFVQMATRFHSRILVRRDSRTMDGKSIMGVLLLAAARGTTIAISADGPDELDAVGALVQLVETGFGEDACLSPPTHIAHSRRTRHPALQHPAPATQPSAPHSASGLALRTHSALSTLYCDQFGVELLPSFVI